jgi:hypothetical protein
MAVMLPLLPVAGGPAFEPRSLDGSANNAAHPAWGQAGTTYRRIAPARYSGAARKQAGGANARYVSNRVFSDLGQNVFSERNVSQWVWTWGQFMDHTFGLARDSSESAPIAFDAHDPLESFRDDLGVIPFKRDLAAPGAPREQVNTVSSYIDGWSVYGGTDQRLEWLRVGPVNGTLADNGASLLLTADGYLPRAGARGNAAAAPEMKLDGALIGRPGSAAVAGDVRANENMALTAVHTLFAREHNRIVRALPAGLTTEQRFQIARRVVGAEQQYVTYHEFLPAVGVKLDHYGGYDPGVDASLGNEFATVAYRAHSMIHGEFDIPLAAGRRTPAQLRALAARGVTVEQEDDGVELTVPLSLAFFNPDLVPAVGLGSVLAGLAAEVQYKNDEQIDNALRSVLFQVPGPAVANPAACFETPDTPGCFQGVVDLGALDVQRGRDHGMPTYNQLRRAFALRPRRSFKEITGEKTDRLPAGLGIDDPRIMDFVKLRDGEGKGIPRRSEEAKEGARSAVRRSTLAARLRAIYGSVGKVDAFVGMVAERHVRGSEFGELQRAVWKQQFQALRAGDRFFYRNDPALPVIRRAYGIDYKHTLADLIALNTDVRRDDLPANVFFGRADAD